MIPLTAVRVTSGAREGALTVGGGVVSPFDRRGRGCDASEAGGDEGGLAEGKGEVICNEIEWRFRVFREPEGDDWRVSEMRFESFGTSSSVMINSASVSRALKRLLLATMVLLEWSDSAMETGRVRTPPDATERGRTVW